MSAKVLLVSEWFRPRVGGVEEYLHELCAHLPRGFVQVLAPGREGEPASGGGRRRGEKSVYPVARAPFYSAGLLSYPRWRPALAAARRLSGSSEFALGIAGKALFEGRLMRRLVRRGLLPGYLVFAYGMEVLRWQRSPFTAWQLRRVLCAAERVVVISEFLRGRLAAGGVPERRLVKLTPGVADFFLASPPPPRAAAEPHFRLLSVGRLVPRKGFDVLLRAFALVRKEFPRLRLDLIGGGPERPRLERLARRLGIAAAVRFWGTLPPARLRRQYDRAGLFVLTPRENERQTEGFGIVYLEAAARGLAAVGTAVGGVPEAVLHGRTGLLARPDDFRSVAKALFALLRSPALARRLAAAGQRRAREQFRWTDRAKRLEKLVSLLAKKSRER